MSGSSLNGATENGETENGAPGSAVPGPTEAAGETVAGVRLPFPQASRRLLRETVMAALDGLCVERPWSGVTMSEVAKAAGVSRQTLYNEFGTRDELARSYALWAADRLLDEIDREFSASDDLEDALFGAFEWFLRTAALHPLVRALEASTGSEGVAALIAASAGRPLIATATDRLIEMSERRWPELPASDVRLLCELLVRQAISHLTVPTSSPQEAGEDLRRILTPFLRSTVRSGPTAVQASGSDVTAGEDNTRVGAAFEAIDAANGADPLLVQHQGADHPKAQLQGRLATRWVDRLKPGASELVRIAARAHHLRRFELPRTNEPATRTGYHRWRRAQKEALAQTIPEVLLPIGFTQSECDRVVALTQRQGLGSDPETQLVEDAACLVFCETDLAHLAGSLTTEALERAVRKTVAKMSPAAISLAAAAVPSGPERDVLVRAAEHVSERGPVSNDD